MHPTVQFAGGPSTDGLEGPAKEDNVKEGLCSLRTFQGFTMTIISIMLCRVQGNIMTEDKEVELGGNVTLRCVLTDVSLEPLQASWLKQINESSINIAVLNHNTNFHIAEEYKSRLNFTRLALNDTAITIWNVSISENSCYKCVFTIRPSGPLSQKTCLQVHDFHAFLHHHVSGGILNATCTATGFPRPTISWVELADEKNEWEVENSNGTVSVISNIQVKTSSSHYGQELICRVKHRGQEMDYKVPRTEKGYWKSVPVLLTILALIFVILIIAVVCWKQHRKKHSGF